MRARFTLTLLTILFLLSTTAGLVAHDHGFTVGRRGYDCTSDHHSEAAITVQTELQQSGRRHHHDCLGCQLSGYRSVVPKSRGGEVGQLPEHAAPPGGHEAPTLAKLPTSRTLRGPPHA